MKRVQTEERRLLIESQRKEMEAAEEGARAEMAANLEGGAAAAKFKEEQAALRAQEERDRVETNRVTLKQQRKIKKLEEIEAKEAAIKEAARKAEMEKSADDLLAGFFGDVDEEQERRAAEGA